jgi:hypothetical protein
MSFRKTDDEAKIDKVLRELALPVQESRGGIVEKLMNEARREVEGQGAQVVLTAADRKAARDAERLKAAAKREADRKEAAAKREADREKEKAKRAAEKDAAGKKREADREKTKAETQALTDVLLKPFYDSQKDMENEGEPEADNFDAEKYLEDMMKEEEDRVAAMTEKERRAYEEEKKMEEMKREFKEKQVEILKKSREADLARKVQDALEGKPSGVKRSGIERSRQQFATFANKDPFSQRMEGDDDEFKIGGKKRTIRKKNRKGIKGTRTRATRTRATRTRATRTRATRTRQRKNRTRTMRKKARKSRNSRK